MIGSGGIIVLDGCHIRMCGYYSNFTVQKCGGCLRLFIILKKKKIFFDDFRIMEHWWVTYCISVLDNLYLKFGKCNERAGCSRDGKLYIAYRFR